MRGADGGGVASLRVGGYIIDVRTTWSKMSSEQCWVVLSEYDFIFSLEGSFIYKDSLGLWFMASPP